MSGEENTGVLSLERINADIIIIGSGQGGVPLAKKLSQKGKQVVLFERAKLGGSCINYGCTPSKMLLASAHMAASLRHADRLGVKATVEVDFPSVMGRIRETTNNWSDGIAKDLKDNGVHLIRAEAAFAGELQVRGAQTIVEAETIIINTGKSPAIPPIKGLAETPFLTYETIWQLDSLPQRTIVVGGGFVGVELGQAIARLGSQVTIIETADRLISREDEKVSTVLQEQLEEDTLNLIFNTRVNEVDYQDGVFIVSLTKGEPLEAECLLMATGRRPNTVNLESSLGGVQLDKNEHVRVDEHFKTSAEGVYAIGDVTGQPAFTHVSWEDHRRIMAILDGQERKQMDRVLGYTIFTEPQIGRAGLTRSQAEEQGYRAQEVEMPLSHVARATETGSTRGFYRMVIDQQTDKILGAALVGPETGELIHVIIAHMERGSTWQDLDRSVHIHPTFAEGLASLARLFK